MNQPQIVLYRSGKKEDTRIIVVSREKIRKRGDGKRHVSSRGRQV